MKYLVAASENKLHKSIGLATANALTKPINVEDVAGDKITV